MLKRYIPFAFEAAVLLAATHRLHGMSTLIGLTAWPLSGNFKDEGYSVGITRQSVDDVLPLSQQNQHSRLR
ncbi:hypothetical protein Rin_00022860 [Candidatus Regiella insecticola 5.15]|uniref:Uncharacterized protein n=1 Tax=Candidatus Regiella insecticola 5.15 TaxID=1005043 RepID=G2H2I3_9ENTR|nr:hypothetical protein Rin_00022860 [Candidatus Regiella insecticola 5.15]